MNETAATLEAKYRRSRQWNIGLAVLTVFLAIVVSAQLMPGQSPTTAAPNGAAADSSDGQGNSGADQGFVRRDADDPMALGDVDAPVVMTEWVDMRCPFCALYSRDTLPILIEEYVDTGQVRLEFHDVVFYGDDSESAAVAARAAGKQDKYVEYLTAVYAEAPEGGHPDLPRDVLIEFAEDAGVPDIDQFIEDMDDPEILKDVEASMKSAQELGVTAVPFFVAGDTAVSGAQPVEVFRDFLDEALEEAE